jgi:ATP-dependent helicase/nuclease subunit B
MLHLITGSANSGKAGRIVESAVSAARDGRSPVIVVPTLAEVRRLEFESAGKAPLGVRIETIDQFVGELWSLFGDGRQVASRQARTTLIRRVLAKADGYSASKFKSTRGFRRLAVDFIGGTAFGAAILGESAPEVLAALRDLREEYWRLAAERGLVESNEVFRALGDARALLDGPVHVLRFDTLNAAELRLFEGLSGANDVLLALTWTPDTAATTANDAIIKLLKAKNARHTHLSEVLYPGEIQVFGRSLFGGPMSLPATSRVVFGLASGGEAECALAASAAREAIQSGVPCERVAIVFPELAHRRRILEAALDQDGVAFNLTASVSLRATALGRAFSALLALAINRGGRTEAETFLNSPLSGIGEENARRLDREWRRRRLSEPVQLLRSLASCDSGVRSVVELAQAVANSRTAEEGAQLWQKVAIALVDAEAGMPRCGADRSHSSPEATGDAYARLSRTIAELSKISAGSFDSAELFEVLDDIVVSPSGNERSGLVEVCELRDLGSRRFDVLILGGLTNDELSTAERDLPLQLVAQDEFDASIGAQGDLARLRFYSAVTRAREKLVLIRRCQDDEGRASRPSPLWEDAVDIYRPAAIDGTGEVDEGPDLLRVNRSDLVEYAPAFSAGRMALRERSSDASFGKARRELLGKARGLGADRLFSATEIEDYLSCHYRWFYRRILRPEAIDSLVDRRVLGIHGHRLLAEFYREAQASGIARVDEDNLPRALELLDEVVASGRRRLPTDGSLGEEFDVRRAEVGVRLTIERDAWALPSFVPEGLEVDFGTDETFEFAGGSFRGRVDRVDSDGDAAFLMDYKSGSDVPGFAKFMERGKVQPVLYSAAIAELRSEVVCGWAFRSMTTGSAAGFYRREYFGAPPLGMSDGDAITESEFRLLVERTEEVVAAALEGMRAGRVDRRPLIKGACRSCEIRTICQAAES